MSRRHHPDVTPELGPLSAGLSNHSAESERSVIGGILLDPSWLDSIAQIIGAEDFFHQWNKEIFGTFLDLRDEGSPIDARTVQARMEQRGVFAAGGGHAYLASLDLDLPDIGRLDTYANIVRDRSRRRALVRSAVELVGKASNGSTLDELASAVAVCSRATAVMVAEDSPAEPRFKTEEEIACEKYPPVSWVLGNILHEGGACMLAGKPGAGKTWWALEFGLRIARGMDFLGMDCPDPRRVFYAAAEGGYGYYQKDMNRLARGLGVPSEGRFALSIWDDKLNSEAARKTLLSELKRFSTEVVILDSLALLFDLKNENDTDGWSLVNDFLLELMHAGLSVLALHHANKADGITGSLSNIRCVDQALVLAKPEDRAKDLDVEAVLRYVKARRVDPRYTAPMTMKLCNGVNGPGTIGYVRVDAHNDRRGMAVALWEGPDQPSAEAVAEEMGISRRTVYRYLKIATELGETRRPLREYTGRDDA
jgi:replicative DNA helicase